MESTYQDKFRKLHRKLKGIEREKGIYEHVLDNVECKKNIIKTKLMRQFGYYMQGSNTDNFERTRLCKYVKKHIVGYITARGKSFRRFHREFRNVIWLPTEVADEFRIKTIASKNQRWGYKLCYKDTIPFWLLEDYGGPYSERDFITHLDKKIKRIKDDIEMASKEILKRIEEDCPCENCICVPTCKYKYYPALISDCRLVGKYLYDTHPFSLAHRKVFFIERLYRIVDLIKTTVWSVSSINLE